MPKKTGVKYTAGEIGQLRVVEDFLPSPDQLVLRENNVKVTLSLSQRSVDFFKRAAATRRVPYQRMIRALVDAYAEKQGEKGNRNPGAPPPCCFELFKTVRKPPKRASNSSLS